MRKLFLLLVLFVIIFTSCTQVSPNTNPNGSEMESDEQETAAVIAPLKIGDDGKYSVSLIDVSEGAGSVFQSEVTIENDLNFTSKEEYDDPSKIATLQVGNLKFYDLNYIATKRYGKTKIWKQVEFYRTADDKVEIRKTVGTDNFSIYSALDLPENRTSLYPFTQDVLTENTLISSVKSRFEEIVPNVDWELYQYEIETYSRFATPNAAWAQITDGFHDSPERYEEIEYYTVNFIQYAANGIPTTNMVCIRTDAEGDIHNIDYSHYNVDWDACEVDMGLVEDAVADWLENAVSHEIASYEIRNMSFDCQNNEVKLKVTVECMILIQGEEYGHLAKCYLG